MKIETGTYNSQISFGITFTNFYDQYKAIILDVGMWYVEFIIKDYK